MGEKTEGWGPGKMKEPIGLKSEEIALLLCRGSRNFGRRTADFKMAGGQREKGALAGRSDPPEGFQRPAALSPNSS